jgi:hypothetical protein
MAIAPNRGATSTKSDAVARPRPGGVWRFDLDYTQFVASGARIAIDLKPLGLSTGVRAIIKATWVEVSVAWTGETTIELDVGSSGGDANEYVTAADLTGTGIAGETQAERGTASDGRNPIMLGDLLALVDVDAGDCANLSAGTAELYVAYEELETLEHVETPHTTPTQTTDPGRGTVI